MTVVDSVENRQFPLKTSTRIDPQQTGTDSFYFPVDTAVEFTTDQLVLPYVVPTCVRNQHGDMLLETEHYAYETLPEDTYLLELAAPIKLYVSVRSEVTIASADDRLAFDFGSPVRVRFGARSLHESPAATVESTADPPDLARAISTFGSALKTTTCERSLPSFRGHPPRLELADQLNVPDEIEPPDTGITIVAPHERNAIYATSPLAYYLGATVVTGENPRVETDSGFEYEMGQSVEAFESSIERILQHVFFLDTVTRTEGIYEIDLYERKQIEPSVSPSFDELYERSLSEQLATYLSIPFDATEELRPTWELMTYLTSDPENATALPFLAGDLSLIRTASQATQSVEVAPAPPADIDAFVRSTRSKGSGGDGEARTNQLSDAANSYVSPPETDAFETAWLGEGTPVGANKLSTSAFENGLNHSPKDASDAIDITIVCNDRQMAAEYDESADGLYGNRDELPFDITVHRNLSTDALRQVFATDTDFLHYIGHADDETFVCSDGGLDARTLTRVGVDTFLLNGCESYQHGLQLIESGSVGGIVTHSEVENQDAIAVGQLIARLLNGGFTLRSAVALARTYRFVGNQYGVVGDGGITIAQSGGGVPNCCRIDSVGDDQYELRISTYHSQHGIGALYIPYIPSIDHHFLAGTELPPLTVSGDTLSRFLQLEQIPVEFDGEFHWSTDDLFDSL
ncbi:hypothetical protein HALLA_01625 (plasmid) [Halostagnicola larsenii XH-48]|uniref:CHAT domain-containing protein n=2 Tax=Halostagnicola larsenii TaxID=353800 RepID=W0JXJ8_9EURY|nr:hypothetical protein HALLA_01625 [Halostagnicola larsenii XH-48]